MTEQSPNASEANTGDVIQLQATVEYRENKARKSQINIFLVEYKNCMQTEMRKCLRCGILVKSPNGGTTGLLKHRSACSKKIPKRKVDRGQLSLGFAKTQKLELAKGFKLITQLVYKDQIPLNTVTKSGALQHMFQREQDVSAKTFRQKKIRDVSAIFLPKRPPPCFCRNVFCRNVLFPSRICPHFR